MTHALAVLRPEPGNTATAARIEARGARAIRLPLFAVRPLDWAPPVPERFDVLLLTSANAVRHGGDGLKLLRRLPVVAVGAATARAAREAGFDVTATGEGGAAGALALVGARRALHLAGAEVAQATGLATIAVYESVELSVDAATLADTVALVHSPRAAARLAALAHDRARIAIAAISDAAIAAAGPGWRAVGVATRPTDMAPIAAALPLAD